MREIKFRAWDKVHKAMFQALTSINLDGDVHSCTFLSGAGDEWTVPVKDLELMQFTGRRDKDGKEIYFGFGGIHPEYGPYYVENGEYNVGSFEVYGPHIKWVNWAKRDGMISKNLLTWVSLGLTFDMNIYQHPELAGGEQMLKTIKAWWHNRHSDPGADHRKMVRIGPKLTDIEAFCDELGRLTDDVAESMVAIDIMLDYIRARVKEIREIREGKA